MRGNWSFPTKRNAGSRICLAILVLAMEMRSRPFELPFTPRKSAVTCLVSSFENDLKCEPRAGHHYRTMTMDSVSSGGSGRSSNSSRGRPVPTVSNRFSTIVEEAAQMDVNKEPGRPTVPEPCHVPPGTAWARDWEQLAAETGVHRSGSVSDYGSTVEIDDGGDQRWHIRQPPTRVVTSS